MTRPTESPIDIDLSLSLTADGRFRCPTCSEGFKTGVSIATHHKKMHGVPIARALVDDDVWRAFLEYEHVTRKPRKSSEQIAREFDSHIGRTTVQAELERFGLYEPITGAPNFAKHGIARILEHPDVTTWEQARKAAAQARGDER